MELEQPYHPPAEPTIGAPAPPEVEHVPPVGFVAYWDWRRIRDRADGVATGRLAPWLRRAACEDSASNLRAACLCRLARGAAAVDAANALSDLAVTGRRAFAEFAASPPSDARLLADVLRGSPEVNERRARVAVTATLDRAYSVAWALWGAPNVRRALRPNLGWIAVSGEDDAPHAPCNIGCTSDVMGELPVSGLAAPILCRAAIKLPRALPDEPLPRIADRAVPTNVAFAELLGIRRPEHFDSLALFIHGLGSRLEESDEFKRLLIERAAAQGVRLAVLSLDLPGQGYSTRIEVPALLEARSGRGRVHGFSLPDGSNSAFPLLGLYRDTIVRIAAGISGGVQYVIGGSLGGNLTLWLAEAPLFSALPSAEQRMRSALKFASWSPASVWESYERSRVTPFEGNGTHMDIGKNGAKKRARDRMNRGEDPEARRSFFEPMQRGEQLLGLHVLGAWGYPPTKVGLLQQSELYGEQYRRTFWAAAYEQVAYSHREPLAPGRSWPFKTIDRPLFIAGGARDVGTCGVMDVYNQIVYVTNQVPQVPGRRRLMLETSHSIADERPHHLADEIGAFFFGRDWAELEPSDHADAVTAASDALYKLHVDGKIARLNGVAWQEVDSNPRTRAIAAARGQVYQLRGDGTIWRYTGTPRTGWELLDEHVRTRSIIAADGELYQLHVDGKIWRYLGTPRRWELLDDKAQTRTIAAARGVLCQLRADATVWSYEGPPRRWKLIDEDPRTRSVVAADDAIYQLRSDGTTWRYEGAPRRWQLLDESVHTRAITAARGALYQLHAGGKIWRYLGSPRRWELIGENARTCAIMAANEALYQIHIDGKIWRYTGPPICGWRLLGGDGTAGSS